jgi:(1->4)-alpha-D-glucan 1-alpha-D-glucosylmutase
VSGPLGVAPPLGSTYRLQLAGLGFTGARSLVGYLHRLGIDTLYCSPILAAAPGSTHGYDVVDPTRLDPALGTEEEFALLLGELAAHQMRLLLDIVPNHMSTDPANACWRDVLRLGQASTYAATFDVDWGRYAGRVMVPTLGRPLAETMDAPTPAAVDVGADGPVLKLAGQAFPLDPTTAPPPGPLSALETRALLARQHYLPAFWRRFGDEGNYRRFFDIDGLVGVRVEDPEVCARIHARILALMADERVAGLRVDHIDGLADPAGYLSWLSRAARADRTAAPVIVVEKILAAGERLPQGWAADGTSGYEFADLAGGLFVEAPAEADPPPFAVLALAAKREVLAASFGSPLDRLTRLATVALDHEHPGHDLSAASLRAATAELTVQLDVYRTYLGHGPPSAADRHRVQTAVGTGAPNLASEGQRALHAVVNGLLGDGPWWRTFAQRWQQLTGAVMAKGVEDTATYRFDGLLGHAEVGSHPDRRAVTAAEFTAAMVQRQQSEPQSLNTTSTHDSKRAEDVRARLYALTEWRSEWAEQVGAWRADQAAWLGSRGGLDPQIQHLVYQTLIALWPLGRSTLDVATVQRIQEYTIKVARESKLHSTWSDPDQPYEALLTAFVERLAAESAGTFGRAAMHWAERIGPSAATTSLGLAVLKITCPGVPDIYQGTEVWNDALTDPDNRRAIDFARLEGLLTQLPDTDGPPDSRAVDVAELLDQWPDGRLKLFVLHHLLLLRRSEAALLADGGMAAIAVEGPLSDHLLALARHHRGRWLLSVVPRLLRRSGCEAQFALGPTVWADTSLRVPPQAPRQFINVLTGATCHVNGSLIDVAEVLSALPVAVLLG